jgi:hypothetical protein
MQGSIIIMNFVPAFKRNILICLEYNSFLCTGCMVIVYFFTSHCFWFLKLDSLYV